MILPVLSYDEAMELAFFGANVVHPKAMAPAMMPPQIPVYIKNTFNPDRQGSCICNTGSRTPIEVSDARGFSTIDNMALINVEGAGMIGVPGIAQRLFSSLHARGISVTLIAQASSEHSICIAVQAAAADDAERAISDAFVLELSRGQVQSVRTVKPCTILAVVGDALRSTPGCVTQQSNATSINRPPNYPSAAAAAMRRTRNSSGKGMFSLPIKVILATFASTKCFVFTCCEHPGFPSKCCWSLSWGSRKGQHQHLGHISRVIGAQYICGGQNGA